MTLLISIDQSDLGVKGDEDSFLLSEYGFLSNRFSYPFTAPISDDGPNTRWRTVDHYVTAMSTIDPKVRIQISTMPTVDEVLSFASTMEIRPDWEKIRRDVTKQGMIYKFKQNPTLNIKLQSTTGYTITSEKDPLVATLLMEVRDELKISKGNQQEYTRVLTNLYFMLEKQGYNTILIGKKKQPLSYIQSLKETTLYTEIREVDSAGNTVMSGELDIQLGSFNDSNLMNHLKEYAKEEKRPDYFLISDMARDKFRKILAKIAAYSNVRVFNPNELSLEPSKHLLAPVIVKLPKDDPLHKLKGRMAELSANDLVARELGLKVGDIIYVNDFSPHPRVVV